MLGVAMPAGFGATGSGSGAMITRRGAGHRLRVAVALSSGGARGFAHVGVLRALQRADVEIVHVAGSSIGAIMAAGYALRGDVDELERRVLDWRPRDHSRRGLLGLPIMESGRITSFFDASAAGARFSDCAVSLSVVATDLRRREPATLTAGPLALAVYASMAMPYLHRPVAWDHRLLAEGALSCVLPLAQARHAPHETTEPVDLVIGSMVANEARRLQVMMTGLAHSVGRAAPGWQRHYAAYFRGRPLMTTLIDHSTLPAPPPTIIVTPEVGGVGPLDFRKGPGIIAAGERAATAALDELRDSLGLG